MKIGIFPPFNGDLADKYIQSCKELGVDYEVVDILSGDWIQKVKESDCDGFICTSTCDIQTRKHILDERYYFVSNVLKKPIYPSFLETFLHENKRNATAWIEANDFPRANTKVFTNLNESIEYLDKCSYPIVFKHNFGAGATKVTIVKNKNKAKKFARTVFPRTKAKILNIGKIYVNNHFKYLPLPDFANPQNFYLLVQDFHSIVCEWRMIKIGDSYFGHQKLLGNDGFASGSGKVGWVDPPKELLHLTKRICEKGNFSCMCIDIFETTEGKYLVNELQSSFGSYLDSQMYINGKPGRYKYKDGEFVFEEGVFNVHQSTKLKVEDFINQLKEC